MTDSHGDSLQTLLSLRRDVLHFCPVPCWVWRWRPSCAPRFAQVSRVAERLLPMGMMVLTGRLFGAEAAGPKQTPEQLAVMIETVPAEGLRPERQTILQTLEQSTAKAIHAMWLVARACNTCVGMVPIINPDRIEALFDLPETWRFTAHLCVGYPEFDADMPLLHRAGWQQNTKTRWPTR